MKSVDMNPSMPVCERDPQGRLISAATHIPENFHAFIKRRELRIPRCIKTGEVVALGARRCADGTPLVVEWLLASGRATLHSFVIYRQEYRDAFPVPYNVAMVELDEGLRLVSSVIGTAQDLLRVGMDLRAAFDSDSRLVFEAAPLQPGQLESRREQNIERT